jgi:hypothetical protein
MNARSGRGWAYAGALLGGLVSVAANVAHSYVPPDGSAAGWSPRPGAVALSIFWPVALFIAVEICARVDWAQVGRWAVVRWVGIPLVGLVAAVVSYRHLSGLLAHYGEDRLTQVIGPLAVDGLMLMATAALVATGRRGATNPAPVSATSAPVAGATRAAVEPPAPGATSEPARPALVAVPDGLNPQVSPATSARAGGATNDLVRDW